MKFANERLLGLLHLSQFVKFIESGVTQYVFEKIRPSV